MRVFIAIELPDEVRAALGSLQERMSELDRAVRWTRPEQMHLTVKFLGEVPDAEIGRVCEATRHAAGRHSPFELAVRGVGCFPPRGAARIVWAGVEGPPPELVALHRDCEQTFADLGFPPEGRAFKPHLTIGRAKNDRGSAEAREVVARQGGFDAGSFAVDELVVFQSILQRGGPQYTPIARCPLLKQP